MRRLGAVVLALLAVHGATHALLIGAGLAWLAAAAGLDAAPLLASPPALALLAAAVLWQSARLAAEVTR